MRILIILLLNSCFVLSQNSGVFVFSMQDESGRQIMPGGNYFFSITRIDVAEDTVYRPEFIAAENMYLFELPKGTKQAQYKIQVKHDEGNSSEIMNINLKLSSQNNYAAGCYNCVCTNIPFTPGNFIMDMPMQQDSWKLLPEVIKTVKGKSVSLKDISIMQNWNVPLSK